MKTLAASAAKNSFGHLLDMAHREPVAIEKHGRAVAVVISMDEYERLDAFDDAYWLARAEAADAEGYLGIEESEAFLRSLNAKD